MTAHVISHRKARRKRRAAWSWAVRRFGALAVTVAALAAATWLAPRYRQTAAPTPAALPPATVETIAPAIAVKPIAAEAPPAARLRPRVRSIRTAAQTPPPIPLNGAGAGRLDGFEVLSAAELAAISQARD